MGLVMEKIKVAVPATSANVGSGFDSIGIALDIFNTYEISFSDQLSITSTDGTFAHNSPKNLTYISAQKVFELCGATMHNLNIVQTADIPMTRGLGSSSSCIVAGIIGANALTGNTLSQQDMLNLACKIEGHPDNTSPAIMGGLVSSVYCDDNVYCSKTALDDDLRFVAVVPNFKMSTNKTRSALPTSVSLADATFNVSRSALLVQSFQQKEYHNLRVAVQDKLHQQGRVDFINGGEQTFQKAYSLGAYAVYLSGAGPTIMSITSSDTDKFVSEMEAFLYKIRANWTVKVLNCNNSGAYIVE